MLGLLGVVNEVACHGMSLCDRPGVTTGQFVRAKSSLAYMALSENDPSHVACKAEATIPATLGFMLEVESELCNHNAVCAQRKSTDTVINPNNYRRNAETTADGGLRALGIGRGIDVQDCRKMASEACEEAVDYFFRKVSIMRPPDILCRMADYHDRCASFPDQG